MSAQPGTTPGDEPNAQPMAGLDVAKAQSLTYATIVKSRMVLEPTLKELHLTSLPHDVDFLATSAHLFQLTVGDSNKSRAESLANSLAKNFMKAYRKLRTDQMRKAVALLEGQVHQADVKLHRHAGSTTTIVSSTGSSARRTRISRLRSSTFERSG
jgi:capsular polysaccharide biosynthesis protein